MPRRLVQLFVGLILYGVSDSMLLLAGLGVDPWDVLHQGLARRTGVPVGTWAIIVGAVVLLLWIPLRQRPGLGTLCNVVLVGAVIDLVLAVVPPPHSLPVQVAVMASGVVLNGVATFITGLLVTASRTPGREVLMTRMMSITAGVLLVVGIVLFLLIRPRAAVDIEGAHP